MLSNRNGTPGRAYRSGMAPLRPNSNESKWSDAKDHHAQDTKSGENTKPNSSHEKDHHDEERNRQ